MKKLVRINQNPNLAGDLELQFEIKIPPEELKVDGYTMQDLKNLRLNGKQKITIGSEIANTDNFTYIRPRKVWDDVGNISEVDILFRVQGTKVYFKKIIPKAFLDTAVYPVYTDTDSSFFSGSGDGNVNTQNQVSWDAAHDDTDGTQASTPDTQTTYPSARKNGVNDFTLGRVFLPIDTSTLPDTDTISSAILYIYYSDVTTVSGNPDGDDITVVESTSASTSTLATTDFDNVGATEYTDTRRTYAEIIAGGDGYYGYTFNSTGISAISKTGYTKLALRCGLDFDDVAPTGVNYLRMKLSEETGTSKDPYLTVTHSSGGGGETPATAYMRTGKFWGI